METPAGFSVLQTSNADSPGRIELGLTSNETMRGSGAAPLAPLPCCAKAVEAMAILTITLSTFFMSPPASGKDYTKTRTLWQHCCRFRGSIQKFALLLMEYR